MPTETPSLADRAPSAPLSLAGQRVLIVGLGGLGCPAAMALARSGATLQLCDDDRVDETNLHRQILFGDRDVGRSKLEAAEKRLVSLGADAANIERLETRLLPDNARELASQADVVIEGSDNYATKFLAADACFLETTPIVHGAAVGWRATVWAVGAEGKPCYRCLFEDLPPGGGPSCDAAGVVGPVVGLAGALMAELALRAMTGQAPPLTATVFNYDGKLDKLRKTPISARPGCNLCGAAGPDSIRDVTWERYSFNRHAA